MSLAVHGTIQSEQIANAVRDKLRMLGVDDSTVEVHWYGGFWIVRIRILLEPWSLKRLWWWWHGLGAFEYYERAVRHRLLNDCSVREAGKAKIFLTLEEP